MSNQQARLSSGGVPPERAPGASRSRSRDGALVPDTPSRSPAGPAAGGTLARTHPGNWCEWSDEAAMQAYLSGDAQRVFAEVLWQALAATLDVQERPF